MTELLDKLDLGILVINEKDQVILANRFLISKELIAENWEGRRFYEVIKSLDLLKIINKLKERKAKEEEFKYKSRTFRVKSVKEENISLFIQDISSIKSFEEYKREFIATVSHELSTPISAIKNLLETMELKEKFDKTLIEKAISRVNDLENIVNSLRYMLIIEKESPKLKEKINIKSLIEDIIEDLKGEIEKSKLKAVKVSLREDPNIMGKRENLYILFKNIIENSIKYNREGGEVKIEGKKEGDIYKISVSDTGIGIPKEDIPFIFTPFYGGKNKKGMGMGLALCDKIAKLYNIDIKVHSEEGKGSTFTLIIKGDIIN